MIKATTGLRAVAVNVSRRRNNVAEHGEISYLAPWAGDAIGDDVGVADALVVAVDVEDTSVAIPLRELRETELHRNRRKWPNRIPTLSNRTWPSVCNPCGGVRTSVHDGGETPRISSCAKAARRSGIIVRVPAV